jgi:hypothetical protein
MPKKHSQKRGNDVKPQDFEQMTLQLESPASKLKPQIFLFSANPSPKLGWGIRKNKPNATMVVLNFQNERLFVYLPSASLGSGWNLGKNNKPLFGASLMMRALKRCRENGGFASYVPRN